ncbi:LPXTG cell wall anchor domain-containing protein [Streptomyces polygonati]|uniref:LPXTG cell wall anchor domain-containing protein n=1 Tax=Streptomyces polygonati TaxID=1617087 RepID=A0ABV8HZ68_9ACTN
MCDGRERFARRAAAPWSLPLAVLAALVLMGAALAPAAHSATGVDTVAAALRNGPVFVDPRVAGQMSPAQATALADRITGADKPVFVAVLPAAPEFPAATALQDLRSAVGITGVYAIHLGSRFNAGADPQVMPRSAVVNLVGQVQRSSGGDTVTEVNSFVDQALRQAGGHAPNTWRNDPAGSGSIGSGTTALIVLVGLAALVAAGGLVLSRRRRKARAARERAQLDRLRTVIDEDITAFGEELDRLDFRPADPVADDPMRGDYARALDLYERAKSLMTSACRPDDVQPVTEALEDGRFALATLDARRAGRPLPERRPPCFFDPRHGPSVRDVAWAPPGGTPREVPACAADAVRIEDGGTPLSRTVDTPSGPEPYWNAGPVYGPYAGGYLGGGLLPGLLIGTLLGGSLYGPGYGDGYGYGGYDGYDGYDDGGPGNGPDGGDSSGSGFDPGDFGGGSGGGGGSDGGFDGGGFG